MTPTPASTVTMGSDRSFGLVMAAAALAVALWPFLGGGMPNWWALAVAAGFALAAAVAPRRLRPLNRLWFGFGMALHRVTTPVVMGLLFVVALLPTALLMRLGRRDPLRLKRDPQAASYWTRRPPGRGGDPGGMVNQF